VERLGLVGLPNAGKSSLFNALTGADVPVARHPFSTTETSTGVAKVADRRLEALAEMSRSRKIVPASFELADVAGLAPGASSGEGLGNRFLGALREVDALVLVVRSFVDDQVPGDADPLGTLAELELELVMADVASLEAQLVRRRRAAKAERTPPAELRLMEEALAVLEAGTPLWRSELATSARTDLRGAFLLTAKPVLVVVNVGEDQLGDTDTLEKAAAEAVGGGAEALAICVQLEAEAMRLDVSARRELLEGLGLGEGALARVSHAAYRLLGRDTFFTTGEKESRAWTFRRGARAPECAGVIHSDLERGFIRAEVIAWEELLTFGSWAAAKAAGRIRLEGKDYAVADGDVLEIRFNV
jgi:GTP-binding protein YchF